MKYETATLITIAALAAIATLVVACTEIIQVDERVTDAVIVDQIAEDNPVARSVSHLSPGTALSPEKLHEQRCRNWMSL